MARQTHIWVGTDAKLLVDSPLHAAIKQACEQDQSGHTRVTYSYQQLMQEDLFYSSMLVKFLIRHAALSGDVTQNVEDILRNSLNVIQDSFSQEEKIGFNQWYSQLTQADIQHLDALVSFFKRINWDALPVEESLLTAGQRAEKCACIFLSGKGSIFFHKLCHEVNPGDVIQILDDKEEVVVLSKILASPVNNHLLNGCTLVTMRVNDSEWYDSESCYSLFLNCKDSHLVCDVISTRVSNESDYDEIKRYIIGKALRGELLQDMITKNGTVLANAIEKLQKKAVNSMPEGAIGRYRVIPMPKRNILCIYDSHTKKTYPFKDINPMHEAIDAAIFDPEAFIQTMLISRLLQGNLTNNITLIQTMLISRLLQGNLTNNITLSNKCVLAPLHSLTDVLDLTMPGDSRAVYKIVVRKIDERQFELNVFNSRTDDVITFAVAADQIEATLMPIFNMDDQAIQEYLKEKIVQQLLIGERAQDFVLSNDFIVSGYVKDGTVIDKSMPAGSVRYKIIPVRRDPEAVKHEAVEKARQDMLLATTVLYELQKPNAVRQSDDVLGEAKTALDTAEQKKSELTARDPATFAPQFDVVIYDRQTDNCYLYNQNCDLQGAQDFITWLTKNPAKIYTFVTRLKNAWNWTFGITADGLDGATRGNFAERYLGIPDSDPNAPWYTELTALAYPVIGAINWLKLPCVMLPSVAVCVLDHASEAIDKKRWPGSVKILAQMALHVLFTPFVILQQVGKFILSPIKYVTDTWQHWKLLRKPDWKLLRKPAPSILGEGWVNENGSIDLGMDSVSAVGELAESDLPSAAGRGGSANTASTTTQTSLGANNATVFHQPAATTELAAAGGNPPGHSRSLGNK